MMYFRRKKGFTLLEILISISILSIAAIAIYSVFSNGVMAWRRGTRNKTYARSLRISSEKVAQDLRNTFKFTDIPFHGERDFLMCAGLVLTEPDKQSETKEAYYQVGRITYYFNRSKKALYKEAVSYPEIASESNKTKHGQGEAVIEKIRDAEFSYCYKEEATGRYKWRDDWKMEEQDEIPQAVKMTLTFERDTEQEEFERLVFIPMGTGEQKKELGKVEIDLGK